MNRLEKLKERYLEEALETVVFTDIDGNKKIEEFSGKDFNQFESIVELYAGKLEREWGNDVSWNLLND